MNGYLSIDKRFAAPEGAGRMPVVPRTFASEKLSIQRELIKEAPAVSPSSGHPLRRQARCVVIGAGLNLFLGTGQVLLFSFGVFVKPIVESTGWSRADVSSAALWGQLLVALASPLTGLAVDRFGARRVARFAGPSLGVGVMLVGVLSNSPQSFTFFFALSFLFGAAQVPVPYVKAVADWHEKRLGLALGSAMILSGVGVAVFPPLSAALINAFGWRHAYVALAIIVWAVSIPSVAFLLYEAPVGKVRKQPGVNRVATPDMAAERGMTLGHAVRTRPFWLIAISFFLLSVVVGAGTHVLPIVLSDFGLRTQSASFVMTIVGAAMMIARFAFGALLDRFSAPHLTALVFFGAALAFMCLAAGISAATVPVAAVLIGIALGSEVDSLAYLASRMFGRRHLGAVYGTLMFCFSFGLGCGPALFGEIYARSGSYHAAFELAAGLAAIAALMLLGIRTADLHGATQRPSDALEA
ncbi:MFS transporter [Paraburkholderia nodosa]|uniref:MFS transporter n=1 Tax=Paraburkholderia nodosa TaxID=392320 RepID=UPI0004B0C424|nr:MFS transporter [Paraburkholderia nodosa]